MIIDVSGGSGEGMDQFTYATGRRVACGDDKPPHAPPGRDGRRDEVYEVELINDPGAPLSSRTRNMASLGSIALLLVTGCLTGDSASRIAFGLREGANRLGHSRDTPDSLTLRVPARVWPNGCPGAYRVSFLPDTAKANGIVVSCLPKGPRYTTTDARTFVRIPVALEVEHQAGERIDITLRRKGADIEVVRLE
jgi:hypothetical protein